jgi:N-methylhydantoinase A
VLQIPVLEMVEVGAGGGSIAWIDEVGGVHVGPRSAGAEPGPACYARGGAEPTVTDANLLLGRLNEQDFAGGRRPLDRGAAERAVGGLAARAGLGPDGMAAGIVDLANLTMAEAVRLVTIRRGLDPRDFVMVAYGGGGPLHASAIARDLAIPTILIPPVPGNFSAIGMLLMDLRRDYSEITLGALDTGILGRMEEQLQRLQDEGRRAILDEEGAVAEIAVQRFADMRYRGQQNTVKVVLPDTLAATAEGLAEVRRRFDSAYEVRYGHAAPEQPAEVVSVRVAVHGIRPRASIERIRVWEGAAGGEPRRRPVYFKSAGGYVECPVYRRAALDAGTRLAGPAVIEEASSTTIVEPGDLVEVNEHGHLLLHVGARA